MSGRSNGGVVGSIPGASKKMVQSLKEIVNCPELEIYTMLKECNMDPNETVNRLLSQDPFHEVKSKREKKKENKDESRSRGTNSSSTRGGRGSHGCTTQYGSSDSGALRGKPAYKKDNGPTAYTSSATGVVVNNSNRRPPPVSDVTTAKIFRTNTSESILPAPSQSSFQSAWGGIPGQVSMADIVKMGRPHAKTTSTSQHHTNDQRPTMPPGVPGPQDLPPSQNYPPTYTGSHHVPPDDDDDWPLDDEPQTASGSTAVGPSADSEPYGDHYDGTHHQYISPSDDVRYAEDDNGDDGAHCNSIRATPGSNQNVSEDTSGSASGFDNEMYLNINSYQGHHGEVEDASVTVSSVTTNFPKLSMPEEEEDSESEDDGPAVKIPDHLQVQSADCSHLSFGSFSSGISTPFSGPFASRTVKSNDEEAPGADSSSIIGHSEARNAEYYESEHLQTAPEGNDAHRMGADSSNYESQSVSQPDMSQQDMLKQEAPEVAQGNQYSFPSSTANYAFENNQQLNASYAHSQTGSQMQGLPLSSVMPYSNSLPSTLLASNVQPLRESELAYSPFPVSQYNNSGSSVSNSAVSIAEAMKTGNFTATQQPTQTIQGSSVSGGHALPQHLLHPYSQPSVPMGPFAGNLINYHQYLPQNYPYMPASAFQQTFAAGNNNYPQSIAAVLPQYKNSVSGYGAAFGNSNNIPSNFPLNTPPAPAGTSMNYDDLLSSQYKDANHLLSLQQGPGSRTVSGVPGSTYYSIQGQNQQASGFRQSQQPSQHYGPISGYPNYYHHSQGSPTLEQQLQMSRDGGSQGHHQQPKQTAQQMWQNGY